MAHNFEGHDTARKSIHMYMKIRYIEIEILEMLLFSINKNHGVNCEEGSYIF